LNQKIILHCGAHKTGSTSFQHLLYTNRAKLLKAGIFCPAVSRQKREQDDVRNLLAKLARPDRHESADREHLCRVIDRIFSENGASTLVISNEDLLGAPLDRKRPDLYPRTELIAPLIANVLQGREVEVRFFIRDFSKFIPSWYVQQVRMGRTLDFAEFVGKFDFPSATWRPAVDALRRSFGMKNVRVFDHAELVRDTRGVLSQAFPEVMNALGDDDCQLLYKNATMDRRMVGFYLRWNRFTAWLGSNPNSTRTIQSIGRRYVLTRLERFSNSSKIQFEPDLAARLSAKYAQELAAIESE
jgi:hypothetical protein